MGKKMLANQKAHPSGGSAKRRIPKTASGSIVILLCTLCGFLIYSRTGISFHNYQGALKTASALLKPFINTTQVRTANNNTAEDENVTLDDIFLSIISPIEDMNETLPVILKTWFQLASNQTWIFTDAIRKDGANFTNDKYLSIYQSMFRLADGHVVMTNCSDIDERKRLCCIISTEYRSFINSGKKWFCSFEDNHYVNVPRAVEVLQKYDYDEDWYLTRETGKFKEMEKVLRPRTLWHDVFGAGMCITRTLMLKLYPVSVDGPFTNVCENEKYPVDVTIQNVISHITGKNLTILPEFHSHYDLMKLIPEENIRDQISLSYHKDNVMNLSGFNESSDPTREVQVQNFWQILTALPPLQLFVDIFLRQLFEGSLVDYG